MLLNKMVKEYEAGKRFRKIWMQLSVAVYNQKVEATRCSFQQTNDNASCNR